MKFIMTTDFFFSNNGLQRAGFDRRQASSKLGQTRPGRSTHASAHKCHVEKGVSSSLIRTLVANPAVKRIIDDFDLASSNYLG